MDIKEARKEYKLRTKSVGNAGEVRAMTYLQSLGFEVSKSSEYEDLHMDIDLWVGGSPVSVKTQPAAVKKGNLVFEVEVLCRRSMEWEPAWYHWGRAEYYIFIVGDKVYQAHVGRLKEYVESVGWDRYTELSKYVQSMQSSHMHLNARVGLMSIDKLLVAGVLWLL